MAMIKNTPSLLAHGNVKLRKKLLEIAEKLLWEIKGDRVIEENIRVEGGKMWIKGHPVDLDFENIYVVGFGKASGEMAQALEKKIGEIKNGVVNTNHGVKVERVKLNICPHPLPDESTVAHSEEILKIVEEAGENDLIIFLISGGGSALFEIPRDGITIAEEREIVGELLAMGEDVEKINETRILLSKVKGGKLLQYAKPASCISLIISDVISRPKYVASGPTWGDYERCENFVIADNQYGKRKVKKIAEELGIRAEISPTILRGEPSEIAPRLVEELKKGEEMVIWGGETTVNVGNAHGMGGRNQELALRIAERISGENMAFLCIGTDGIDGPTDAAGGIVDGETMRRINRYDEEMKEHNSYGILKNLGDAIITGHTGANIADICLGIKSFDYVHHVAPLIRSF